MNEEEIIKRVKRRINDLKLEFAITNEDLQAIEGLLDLYQKEKEKTQELDKLIGIIKYDKENNYISKNRVEEMLKELEDRENKKPVVGYWSKRAMLEKLLKEN